MKNLKSFVLFFCLFLLGNISFGHHPIKNSIIDELNNKDAVMDFALNLIETNMGKQIAAQKK